jgi:hypothetical protein
MKITSLLSGAGLAVVIVSTASAATPFGPATGAIVVLGSPSVTLGALSGSASFSSPVAIFGTTGDLTAASGGGTASGTLDFSNIPLAVLPETLSNFMTFADNSGGSFFFNVSSVETIAYSSTAASTSVTLYLLGMAGDTHLGLSVAPTSETITLNSTSGSAYSASASIAAPPSIAAPEPASWALMLIGVGSMGGWMRRARSRKPALAA